MQNVKRKAKNSKRNYGHEILVAFAVMLLLLAVLIGTAPSANALGNISGNFGGPIVLKLYQVCLLPAPPPVFVIPIPFVYYVIGPPVPAMLYYVYGVSRTYRRYARDVTANALGTFWPGVDKFRFACINGFALPEADGIINKIGTSCPIYNPFCELKP